MTLKNNVIGPANTSRMDPVDIDELLILVRHLRNHLALIRPDDDVSAEELHHAQSLSKTLLEKLEVLEREIEAELRDVVGDRGEKDDDQVH
jgi:hypothetical protein